MKLHLLAGFRVGPAPDVTAHDFVSFGNDVFNRQMQIRHRLVHTDHHLLVAIDASRLSAWTIMVVEVRCHILADYGGISPIDEIVEMVSDELFHLIQRELRWHVSPPLVKLG